MKFACALVFSLLLYSKVMAQGSANGCLISSANIVYQTPESSLVNAILQLLLGGNPSYRASSGVPLSPDYCSWSPSPTSSTNCGVCMAYTLSVDLFGNSVITGCQANMLRAGHLGNYTMVQCPLDDYTFPLTATAGLFGIFFIRKRKLF